MLLPLAIQLLQLLIPYALLLILMERLQQQQGASCVLNRVMLAGLNVLFEDDPGEKAERETAVTRLNIVDVDCVEDAVFWDK